MEDEGKYDLRVLLFSKVYLRKHISIFMTFFVGCRRSLAADDVINFNVTHN